MNRAEAAAKVILIRLPRGVRTAFHVFKSRVGVAVCLALLLSYAAFHDRVYSDFHCGMPALRPVSLTEGELYGRVHEPDLPWFGQPPEELLRLKEELGIKRYLVGFRATLLEPLFDEITNIRVAAEYVAGSVVHPGEVFSVLKTIGPYTEERGYRQGPSYMGGRVVPTIAGGVCKISSVLYNVVILSDLPVVERHPHSMQVPYLPPGRDATIAWGAKDFRFRNGRESPLIIWAEMTDDTLYIAFYADFDLPRVEWQHEEIKRTPFETIRRPNPELPPGEEVVVIEGYDGVTVRSSITVTYPGQSPEVRMLSTDTYRPMTRVIEYGPQ